MKKWVKRILIILIIIAILIAVGMFIYNRLMSNVSDYNESQVNMYLKEYVVGNQDVSNYVVGTGTITSFNAKKIDVSVDADIRELYVNDGDIVNKNQKLFKYYYAGENNYAYSSIYGMFFEVEDEHYKYYYVYDMNDTGIEFYVSESDAVKIQVGQKVIAKVVVLNKEVEGTVKYISKLPKDGKYKIQVSLPVVDDIKFGYGAIAKVLVEENKDSIVIPYTALFVDDSNRYYVIKKENIQGHMENYSNTNNYTYVEVGHIDSDKAEILSGLNKGDIIGDRGY